MKRLLAPRHVLLAGLLVALATVGLSTRASAAAPHVIIVTGSPLSDAVYLSDFQENHNVLLSISDVQVSDDALTGRPYLDLALFWGLEWQTYIDSSTLSTLQVAQADQHGRFYPAVGDLPPVLVLDGSGQPPRIIGADGITILERHGIPIRLDSGLMTTNDDLDGGWMLAGGGIALATLLIVGGMIYLRWHDQHVGVDPSSRPDTSHT